MFDKMYDGTKVVVGLVIFLGFFTFPFVYNIAVKAMGGTVEASEVEKVAEIKGKKCVLSVPEMRDGHINLLETWRLEVVRDGERGQINIDGKMYDKSLTKACLDCHQNKEEFCDKCHDYAGVDPNCWTCHIDPKERK